MPYAVHPLHMAIMLARLGLDEHLIQAALLHDVVEDCDGWDEDRLRGQFDDEVVAIVSQLTEDKDLSWRERKEAGIAKVSSMSSDAAAVKAADALHNLESLRVSLEQAPDNRVVWKRFRGGRDGTLDVMSRMVDALTPRVDDRLSSALEQVLEGIRRLA